MAADCLPQSAVSASPGYEVAPFTRCPTGRPACLALSATRTTHPHMSPHSRLPAAVASESAHDQVVSAPPEFRVPPAPGVRPCPGAPPYDHVQPCPSSHVPACPRMSTHIRSPIGRECDRPVSSAESAPEPADERQLTSLSTRARAAARHDHQVRPADAGDHLALAAADAAVGRRPRAAPTGSTGVCSMPSADGRVAFVQDGADDVTVIPPRRSPNCPSCAATPTRGVLTELAAASGSATCAPVTSSSSAGSRVDEVLSRSPTAGSRATTSGQVRRGRGPRRGHRRRPASATTPSATPTRCG